MLRSFFNAKRELIFFRFMSSCFFLRACFGRRPVSTRLPSCRALSVLYSLLAWIGELFHVRTCMMCGRVFSNMMWLHISIGW